MKIRLLIILLLMFGCSKDSDPQPAPTPSPTPEPVVKFSLTISAGQGGSISTSGGTYDNGTSISVTATPQEGFLFESWSDGNTTNPRTITVNSNINLIANFILVCVNEIVEPVDLQQSSYDLFEFKFPLDSEGGPIWEMIHTISWYGATGVYFDYNNDGYLDVIGFSNNYDNLIDMPEGYTGYERKQFISFYLGNCNGEFTQDTENHEKFKGLVHGRKLLLGDFNKDEFIDFFFVGHGYDRTPFPGEFPKVLMSNGSGGFEEIEYTNEVSFFHGGSSADFDNDGDLDVFLIDAGRGRSAIYLNDNGSLIPTIELIDQSIMSGMFNTEFFDINDDGYFDIIAGGHDWVGSEYENTPIIIFGDGEDFIDNTFLRLPESKIDQQGVVTDFEFFDISGNGNYEIIIARTGDNTINNTNFYKDWSIQILELENGSYIDSTEKFIDIYQGSGNWIDWIKISIEEEKVIMHNGKYPQQDQYKKWELSGSMFIRIE